MKSYDYYYLAKRNILSDASNRSRLIGTIKKGKRVHVSAVCGKAMASVACMLKEFGCYVTGSDSVFHPPMSDVLDNHGIVRLLPSISNLKNIDLLVVGNALSYSGLEVVEARKRNIPMLSGAEVVAQIFKNKRSIVVAGTHGKTTTSALLTHIFMEADKDPAYMIGGVFQNSKDSYGFGSKKTKHIIYEGDEYNCAFFDRAPKFLRYNGTSAILTSIEHDHFDLYPSFEDYKQAFQFLIEDLPKKGYLVVHQSVLPLVDLSKCLAKVFIYGSSNSCDAFYKINKVDSNGTTFSLHIKGFTNIKKVFIPTFGEYNIANATSVFTLALLEGISVNKIIDGMRNFPGTKERQELLGVKKENIVVIRDYAHHPTAVTLTLDALRLRYPKKRLVAVFEPRSSTSRRKIFEEGYSISLTRADVSIIVSPQFKETDNRADFVNVYNIEKYIKSKKKIAFGVENCKEALAIVSKKVLKGDVVIFMSSGDFDSIPQLFLKS